MKNTKIFLKNKKIEDEKWSETDIKIFLKNKKKNYVSIRKNIIQRIKSNYLVILNILGQPGLFQRQILEALRKFWDYFMSLKIFLLKNFFGFYAWFDPGYCILHYYNDQNIFKKTTTLKTTTTKKNAKRNQPGKRCTQHPRTTKIFTLRRTNIFNLNFSTWASNRRSLSAKQAFP